MGGRGLAEALEEVRGVFERERAILVAAEAGRLSREGRAGALDALRGAAEGDGALLDLLMAVEGGGEGEPAGRAAEVEARARRLPVPFRAE